MSRPGSLLLISLLLGACVGLHGYPSVAALREDALAVFKAHNQTAGAVMLALAELDPDAPAAVELADAEAAMLAACEPLNELAIAHREGRQPTPGQRRRLPAAIEACRLSTRETQRLLDASRAEPRL